MLDARCMAGILYKSASQPGKQCSCAYCNTRYIWTTSVRLFINMMWDSGLPAWWSPAPPGPVSVPATTTSHPRTPATWAKRPGKQCSAGTMSFSFDQDVGERPGMFFRYAHASKD